EHLDRPGPRPSKIKNLLTPLFGWKQNPRLLILGLGRAVPHRFLLGTGHRSQRSMDAFERQSASNRPANSNEEAHFRRMADVIPAMIWMTDANHLCSYLNRSWQEFTGQTEEQGLGRGVVSVFHPDDRERIGQQYLEAATQM